MRILYERCCGLDIHKVSIAVCVVITRDGKTEEETRRFGTMTADLLELAAWLKACAIQHVAMESTGVYWKPVWNILEAEGFDLLLANAQEGQDCAWAQDGSEGQPVDRRSAPTWLIAEEFCATETSSRSARSDEKPGHAGARPQLDL